MTKQIPASVDVVIVNWHSGRLTEKCAASLAASESTRIRVGKLTVVDNGSDSAELPDLRGLPFETLLLRNSENAGFGAACNQGAAQGKSEFMLFLNPDTELSRDALSAVYEVMHASPDIGVCGIRTVGTDGATLQSCARLPRPRHLWNALLGLDQLAPHRFPGILLRDWDHLESRDVDHVIGAFYFMRRELFVRLGGFDERFFVYLEDLDLSARVRQSRARIRYLAEPPIKHIGGGASGRDKGARLCYSLRSRILYAGKHLGRLHGWAILAGTLTIEFALRLARGVATLRMAAIVETLRAYRLLWSGLPALIREIG